MLEYVSIRNGFNMWLDQIIVFVLSVFYVKCTSSEMTRIKLFNQEISTTILTGMALNNDNSFVQATFFVNCTYFILTESSQFVSESTKKLSPLWSVHCLVEYRYLYAYHISMVGTKSLAEITNNGGICLHHSNCCVLCASALTSHGLGKQLSFISRRRRLAGPVYFCLPNTLTQHNVQILL